MARMATTTIVFPLHAIEVEEKSKMGKPSSCLERNKHQKQSSKILLQLALQQLRVGLGLQRNGAEDHVLPFEQRQRQLLSRHLHLQLGRERTVHLDGSTIRNKDHSPLLVITIRSPHAPSLT